MPEQIMLVNAVAKDECRIAIVEDGRLEELYVELASAQTHVGNIYTGKVVNVEPAIQAAFIDFSVGRNGFLHISDLHPKYFPGEDADTTERVGKKTPRRARPPIQDALKKGQQILVQVLKDSIGTKGPTLTSYLSIPGRYLVMMPNMENLGVSRRVEDEDRRRAMRKVLDSLDTPEGFGFILRTAGMDRTKAELKRDLAFLQRLWKDMQRQRGQGGATRELYSESDLLIRTIRDVLSKDVTRIVIDDISALKRIDAFLRVVAPRSGPELAYYDCATPIFHSFGIERQIADIRSPTVPLPSGGSLVIEQTEALVAIDVNSGRGKLGRDAETTAYRTNLEAVREIARQVRLRDLGGLVVNDLIDMISREHQATVEERFRSYLKRDRARTKILRTSQFGIIEMTRQRMRGGILRSQHSPCPRCDGTGHVKRAETVSLDAMRHLAALLDVDVVQRVEMAVSPHVASEMLSSQRTRLSLYEQRTGKTIDVRVSEDIPSDRVDYYAYDARGADINLERLPGPRPPSDLRILRHQQIEEMRESTAETLTDEPTESIDELVRSAEAPEESPAPSGRKRRRRSRRKKSGQPAAQSEGTDAPDAPIEDEAPADVSAEPTGETVVEHPAGAETSTRRRRRRRGRRGKKTQSAEQQTDNALLHDESPPADDVPPADRNGDLPPATSPTESTEPSEQAVESGDDKPASSSRRRRRRRRKPASTNASASEQMEVKPDPSAVEASDKAVPHDAESTDEAKPTVKKTRRRRKTKVAPPAETVEPAVQTSTDAAPVTKKKRRTKTTKKPQGERKKTSTTRKRSGRKTVKPTAGQPTDASAADTSPA
ncbi:MAG: Rne/Rng family ribonuclease [Phycisphaerales bacterium]|nr:Rne/Rng family ribonuclease [Phycisphaerales bacterium]